MRKFTMTVAGVAMLFGSVITAQSAQAAQAAQPSHDTVVYTQPPTPTVKAFDCQGTTGNMGCGPGWFWRDGWRGWGCYPC
jgi:hypothetical protein